MSTSLLYHAFGIRGYPYIRTGSFERGRCPAGPLRDAVGRGADSCRPPGRGKILVHEIDGQVAARPPRSFSCSHGRVARFRPALWLPRRKWVMIREIDGFRPLARGDEKGSRQKAACA